MPTKKKPTKRSSPQAKAPRSKEDDLDRWARKMNAWVRDAHKWMWKADERLGGDLPVIAGTKPPPPPPPEYP